MLELTSSAERVSSTPLQRKGWQMAIENRNLAIGTRLAANYKKVRYMCTVEAGEGGEGIAYVLEDGRRFKSPSSAAMAIIGSAANGWRWWSLAEGDQPKPAAASPAPKKKSGSKTKTIKLFKRL